MAELSLTRLIIKASRSGSIVDWSWVFQRAEALERIIDEFGYGVEGRDIGGTT